MGSLVPLFISLLVAVAIIAALVGSVASRLAQRRQQRGRRYFIVGFLCGLTAGVVVRRRWREVGRYAVRALGSAGLPSRIGRSPQRHRRLPAALLAVRR